MESLRIIQKERTTFFFTTKAVNFFNEHRYIYSINIFVEVIFISAKIVDLDDIIASSKNIKLK